MLYNEDQDDDEMADEIVKRQLTTTVELQNEYLDLVKD